MSHMGTLCILIFDDSVVKTQIHVDLVQFD